MMWLTWRQFRAQAIVAATGLALMVILLLVTGVRLAHQFDLSGIAGCQAHGNCELLATNFMTTLRGSSYQAVFLITTVLIYAVPALVGVFWGAPLITREIEPGTVRLAWTQSVTRSRWIAAKVSLIGLVAMAIAGLLTLVAGWWANPVYAASAKAGPRSNVIDRLQPTLFGVSGIAPIGYAAFGFALGLTLGVLIRRTLPAMAATLAVFAGIQIGWSQLIRPHLLTPLRNVMRITASNLDSLMMGGPGSRSMLVTAAFHKPGAWILSRQAINAAGRPFTGPPTKACEGGGMLACNASVGRLNLRQIVTYQPASRYWTFQWYETAIFMVLALLLAWFCYWRVSRRKLI